MENLVRNVKNHYSLDTEQTLLSRIAAENNTLPKYIRFTKKGRLVDFLKVLKETPQFEEVLQKLNPYLDVQGEDINIKKDLLLPWIAYNTELEELVKFSSSILDDQGEKFVEQKYFDSVGDFRRAWNDRNNIRKTIESRIEANEISNAKTTKLYKRFDQIDNGFVFTDYQVERSTLELFLEIEEAYGKLTLLELFNYVKLNNNVPFSACINYFKILKSFVPKDDWGFPTDNTLELRINNRDEKSNDKTDPSFDKYHITTIEEKDKQFVAVTQMIIERGYLKKEDYIKRLFSAFVIPLKYNKAEEYDVSGIFYFPQERLHTGVFSDLIMNEPMFSTLLYSDESNKATKRHENGFQTWLYMHFDHPITGEMTINMSQRTIDHGESELRELNRKYDGIFPHNSPAIRVKIQGKNIESVEFLQKILSKIMVVYSQKYDEIVEFYKQFIPDYGIIQEYAVKERKHQLDSQAPDIFIKTYSRTCPDDRMPIIIPEEDIDKYKYVMKFPRDPRPDSSYPSDGLNQQYYTCDPDKSDYIYPGLQKNNLANSDKYPFTPCCFKIEQENKRGSIYRHYYFDEHLEQKEKKQQELIVTDKFLSIDKFGKLPEDLEKLFTIIDTERKYTYLRMGVTRNTNSFIHAVCVGLDHITEIFKTNEKNRNKYVSNLRNELSSGDTPNLAKQCSYDRSLEEIVTDIANENSYFDPNHYVQLLETFFDCNIFLFDKEKLFLPKFVEGYITNTRKARSVFIYVHWGSESDHAAYPQCELIVRTKEKTNLSNASYELSYDYEDDASVHISKLFRILNLTYYPTKMFEPIVLPELNIIGQEIDKCGKCRRIDIRYLDEKMTLLCEPIPPLASPLIDRKIREADVNIALDFCKKLSAYVIQVVENDKCVELNGLIGNVRISIPVKVVDKLLGIDVIQNKNYYKTSASDLLLFNKNKKMARYLTEYIFWLFSKYLEKEKIEELTDKVLSRFAKENILIVENYQYGYVPKMFTMTSGVMKDGKLVCQSIDMMKRLMYVLKLYSIRNIKTLREYYQQETISQYYIDISDFDNYTDQVILQGDDVVEKWIFETNLRYVINNEIKIGSAPYFFQNKNIGSEIFLAQNCSTIERAVDIGEVWANKGYNVGTFGSNENKNVQKMVLYSYVNDENITEHDLGVVNKEECKYYVMGYKISGKPYYTVLMKI